jgi:hypothetical protein
MDQMTQQPVAVARPGPALAARIGLVGVAAAALVAVGILGAGAVSAPSGLLAADDPSDAAETDTRALAGGPGFGRAFGGITITAIDGSNLSLETVDGWTRTITVDADTEYSKSGDEISLADLRVGDEVRFRQTLEDDGTWTIDVVVVIPPHAGGMVTAIDGSTITVERPDGTTATITVTGQTEFVVNGEDATLADVEVDMILVAEGAENADGSLTATEVRAAEHRLSGGFGRPGAGFGGPGDGLGGPGDGLGGPRPHGPHGFWFDGDTDDDPDADEDLSAS